MKKPASPNWVNKTVWTGDNLPIMRGMNSASVDLIYLDPPFNSKADYAAPIGSIAAGAAFKDTWTLCDIDVTWLDLLELKHPALYRVIRAAINNSDKSYLIYMAVRLLEMKRLLKPTGSLYLHCDPTMSHYLKIMLDALFGRNNYRNEIIWCYTGPTSNKAKQLPRKHDVIFWYSSGDEWMFNSDDIRIPYSGKTMKRRHYSEGTSGIVSPSAPDEVRNEKEVIENFGKGKIPESWWRDIAALTSQKERTGFATQKPLSLLERIVKASSHAGDVVFDPFCGCATTLVAADRLQRAWIGIDISPKAVELVVDRIKDDQGLFEEVVHRTDNPKRTDLGDLKPYNSPGNKEMLYGKQKGYCNGCKVHFEERHLEVDHIIAESVGGTNHIDNLQLLCGNCNRVKGNRGQEYLISRINERLTTYGKPKGEQA